MIAAASREPPSRRMNGQAVPQPPETIEVETKSVSCDGGDGALGHPRIYMNLSVDGPGRVRLLRPPVRPQARAGAFRRTTERVVPVTLPTPAGSGPLPSPAERSRGILPSPLPLRGEVAILQPTKRSRVRGAARAVQVNKAANCARPPPTATKTKTRPNSAATPAATSAATMKHLYLVDGSGYIFRAYHALPPLSRARRHAGRRSARLLPTCWSSCSPRARCRPILRSSSTREGSTLPQRPVRRIQGQRPPPPDDLIPQFRAGARGDARLRRAGIELPGYEADDLIATYARSARDAGARGGDRLVRQGPDAADRPRHLDARPDQEPADRRGRGAREVRRRPEKVVDVQALIGDTVDNVPGVPGIGPRPPPS